MDVNSQQYNPNPVYVVITPARDEQDHIETTISTVIEQTLQPAEWIIVNDGSNDQTGSIADSYASKYPWIHVIHVKDRGHRSPGTGVIQAFYEGYRIIGQTDWEFLIKLDADLELSPKYFESCFRHFRDESSLGIAGGTIRSRHNGSGKCFIEKTPRFHVRGATKIYRRQCWNEIGGLLYSPGWDTWDEVKANYCGWKTRTFDDVPLTQLRGTGEVEGHWQDFVKNGKANYVCGYHPLFMLAKFSKRFLHNRTRKSSVALIYGYLSSAVKAVEQVQERDIIKYLRREQLKRLLGLPSIWN